MNKPTLLEKVQAKLGTKTPKQLAEIAVGIGINYATVTRIRDGVGDPAYGKVQALATFLGVR